MGKNLLTRAWCLKNKSPAFLEELIQKATPLLSEQVGTGQATVSTNHAHVGDAALNQVVCSFQTALAGTELFTAGTSDDCTTLRKPHIIVIFKCISVMSLIFHDFH